MTTAPIPNEQPRYLVASCETRYERLDDVLNFDYGMTDRYRLVAMTTVKRRGDDGDYLDHTIVWERVA